MRYLDEIHKLNNSKEYFKWLILFEKLKYVERESTPTPGSLYAIPSGVLNRLAKVTSRKPLFHSEAVDKI